jgi:hypothetical protein
MCFGSGNYSELVEKQGHLLQDLLLVVVEQ